MPRMRGQCAVFYAGCGKLQSLQLLACGSCITTPAPLTCFVGGLAAGNVQLDMHAGAVAAGMQLPHRRHGGQEGAVAVQASAAGGQAVNLQGTGAGGQAGRCESHACRCKSGGGEGRHACRVWRTRSSRQAGRRPQLEGVPAQATAAGLNGWALTWDGGASATSSTS